MLDNICVLNLLKNVHYKCINMAGTTYNITKGLKCIRGGYMDYKKEIIKTIDEIESQKILRYIYLMLLDIPKRYWR